MLHWLQTLFSNFKINSSQNNLKSCVWFQKTIMLFSFIRLLQSLHQRKTYMMNFLFFFYLLSKSTHHHRIYMFAVKKNNFYCEYSHGLWLKLGWMLPCLPRFPLLHLRQRSNPTFNAKIVSAMSGISCLISSKINSADLFWNYLISGISIQVIYKTWCEKHFHG